MQFVFQNLVFPFQFNEMRLNCHTKPPRLDETSDSIRGKEVYTRARICRSGIENCALIFSGVSATNRDYGTRSSLRTGPAETIFPQAASQHFAISLRFSANVHH